MNHVIEVALLYGAVLGMATLVTLFTVKVINRFDDLLDREYRRGWNDAMMEHEERLRIFHEGTD